MIFIMLNWHNIVGWVFYHTSNQDDATHLLIVVYIELFRMFLNNLYLLPIFNDELYYEFLRSRLEKQRRADEEAEQLRHIASENFAANRARTAERKEREQNRPNIIKQGSPALEIKAINPS